jgi:hypothetical protein
MNERFVSGRPGCIALAMALCSASVHAQESVPPSPNDSPGIFSAVGSGVGKAFAAPFHPVIRGVASGGGIGAGVGYDHPSTGPWQVGMTAVATVNRYWLLEFDSEYSGDRVTGEAYARVRDMSRLYFFGAGPDSAKSDQTSFTLRDPVVGVRGAVKVLPAVAVGGRVEEIWPRLAGGRHPDHPSIETRFGDSDAPGLGQQPRFGRYQTFVEVTAPAADGWGLNQGGSYRLSYELFDDQQMDRFDFHRVEIEGRHRFAGFRPYQTVTFRGWVSSAGARPGHQVPFYLQHTIGGTSNIRSLHDAPLGGDGTAATLRAFSNHRFRDHHLVLLQSEYRWSVWGPVDATVFVEAGKAVGRRSDLDLSGLKSAYGFSLNMVRATGPVARFDFGFGGGEGSRVFIGLGGLLP